MMIDDQASGCGAVEKPEIAAPALYMFSQCLAFATIPKLRLRLPPIRIGQRWVAASSRLSSIGMGMGFSRAKHIARLRGGGLGCASGNDKKWICSSL